MIDYSPLATATSILEGLEVSIRDHEAEVIENFVPDNHNHEFMGIGDVCYTTSSVILRIYADDQVEERIHVDLQEMWEYLHELEAEKTRKQLPALMKQLSPHIQFVYDNVRGFAKKFTEHTIYEMQQVLFSSDYIRVRYLYYKDGGGVEAESLIVPLDDFMGWVEDVTKNNDVG